MKAAPFIYHDPCSRSQLHELLRGLDDIKLLAGGQSLMPMLNMRVVAPENVIDLNRIPDLSGIRTSAGTIEIGAMTRQLDLQNAAEIKTQMPIMVEALAHVGHFQTRSRGTIGGSCCHLDPAAELPAVCALYDAEFCVAGEGPTRNVAARDWFRGYLESALEEREFLEAIRFAPWPAGHGYGFHEYSRRHGDFAAAGAGALITIAPGRVVERAAIVVFGVASAPVRLRDAEEAIVGTAFGREQIVAAVTEARAIEPMHDAYVSAESRRRLAGVMVERALRDAAKRATSPT